MLEAASNINSQLLTPQPNVGINTGYLEPDILVAAVVVPIGTVIPASALVSQAAFATYIITSAGPSFQSNTPTNRWLLMYQIDDLKDGTKQPAVDDSGLVQSMVAKYNTLLEGILKGQQANMGNWQEWLKINNKQNLYSVFFIDLNGTWWGAFDPTGAGGLASIKLSQLWVGDRIFKTDKKLAMYPIRFQVANRAQMQEQFAYYPAQTDPTAIAGLQNLQLTDVSAVIGTELSITTTTTVVLVGATGQNSVDFFQEYGALLTAACFRAYDLTAAAAVTITSRTYGTIVKAGQTYNYMIIVLSAAPTATHQVVFSIATASAVNAVVPLANVTIDGYPGNTQYAALHTF